MSHPERTPSMQKGFLLTAALLSVVVLPVSARAGGKKADFSLDLIPANVAFYGAMLRNREQVDAVANSKTWAKLTQLSYYKLALKHLKKQYEESDDKYLVAFRQWMKQQENHNLVDLLADAVSTEIFCYGGGSWIDFIDLMQEINAGRYGELIQLLMDSQGKDHKARNFASVRGVLRAGRESQENQVPRPRHRLQDQGGQ